ncbi:MAG: HAD family phosphatase [Butyricicoccus pullicaecorum]|nr:HAD family phosphatase [Butyricicoccus pullicaecorum]
MQNLFDFSGFIFDLDGTLLDSLWVWRQVDIISLKRRGIDVPDDYAQAIAHLSFAEAAQYTIDRFHLTESPKVLMEEWYAMAVTEYRDHVMLKPDVRAFLEKAHTYQIPMAAATASDYTLITPTLKRLGVFDLFQSVTTIQEVTRDKSFPDIYLLAAERLGVPPEKCVVYEDILLGIQSAKSAGFYTVGVEEPFSLPNREKIKQTAHRYIESFADLL